MKYSHKSTLGSIGERLVADHFGAKLSEDLYDKEKDMTMPDGTTIEVKTQYPLSFGQFSNTTFTVKVDQLPKCLNCDKLIFVGFDETDTIRIYECVDRNKFVVYNTRDGRQMAGWELPSLKLISAIQDKDLAMRMQDLTSSKYLKRVIRDGR